VFRHHGNLVFAFKGSFEGIVMLRAVGNATHRAGSRGVAHVGMSEDKESGNNGTDKLA
jgi:hypothetical protein